MITSIEKWNGIVLVLLFGNFLSITVLEEKEIC